MPVKQKDGTWRGFVNRVIDGKRRPLTKRGFPSEKSAKKWEAQMLLSHNDNPASMKFKDLAQEYIDSKEGSVEPSTLEAIVYKVDHFMASLKDKKVDAITPSVLNKWRNEIVDSNYSVKYKNEIIKMLCAIFKFAASTYYLRDPSLNLRSLKEVFGGDIDSDEVYKVIGPEEFQRIYEDLPEETDRDRYVKALILTAWSTGMRRGEVKAIQWKNYQDMCFAIRKAAPGKIKGDRAQLKTTKTKNSTRRINTDPYCDAELRRLLSFVKMVVGYNENWFMFGGQEPIPNTTLQQRFNKAVKDSGVKRIRFHDLRHSHATLLLDSGVPISAVSARLGHSSITQTTKTYLHASKTSVAAVVTELPNLHFGNRNGNHSEVKIKKSPS